MVDISILLSAVLIVAVGGPTALLIVARIIAFFRSFAATKAVTLAPAGEPKGKALIVYEPGATSLTGKAAEEIGRGLQGRGYEVRIAGIRAPEAQDTSGYGILLLGTPTYMGRPTDPVVKFVKRYSPDKDQIFGIFLTGGLQKAPEVGIVPKVFLDTMNKHLVPRSIEVKVMAFIGFRPYDYTQLVARLLE